MTQKQSFFAVFCIEAVADELNTTGDQVYKMLTDESDILDNYIVPCYDVLHTQGKEYIVEDLKGMMEKRGVQNQSPVNDEQAFWLRQCAQRMIANRTLVGNKCADVIKAYAAFEKIPLREAFDVFYRSYLYLEIRHGVSDMHCRSDGYLAEELQMEVGRKQPLKQRKGNP